METFEPHFTFQGFRYVLIEEYPGDVDIENFEAVVIHSDMERVGDFSCSNELVNQLHHNILWGLKGNFVDIPPVAPKGWLGWSRRCPGIYEDCLLSKGCKVFFKWFRDIR